jgi:hypothetical protein
VEAPVSDPASPPQNGAAVTVSVPQILSLVVLVVTVAVAVLLSVFTFGLGAIPAGGGVIAALAVCGAGFGGAGVGFIYPFTQKVQEKEKAEEAAPNPATADPKATAPKLELEGSKGDFAPPLLVAAEITAAMGPAYVVNSQIFAQLSQEDCERFLLRPYDEDPYSCLALAALKNCDTLDKIENMMANLSNLSKDARNKILNMRDYEEPRSSDAPGEFETVFNRAIISSANDGNVGYAIFSVFYGEIMERVNAMVSGQTAVGYGWSACLFLARLEQMADEEKAKENGGNLKAAILDFISNISGEFGTDGPYWCCCFICTTLWLCANEAKVRLITLLDDAEDVKCDGKAEKWIAIMEEIHKKACDRRTINQAYDAVQSFSTIDPSIFGA